MKQRFSFLSFKKPLVWILIAALLLSTVVVCLLINPYTTEVPDGLDACIRATLRSEHASAHTAGKYPAVAYTTLGVKEQRDSVTVYGVMMYREYTCTTQNELKTWATAHMPFAITAKQAGDGYELVECWWPEDGTGYEASIKKKFPARFREKVTNYQRYYGPHELACEADALANVTAAQQYTVLQSENENAWVAYQAEGNHAYIVTAGSYRSEGTYVIDNQKQMVLTFGTCTMVLDLDGNSFLYNAEDSQSVPTAWETKGDVVYLAQGIRFRPIVRGNTAVIGDTLTIESHGAMTDTDIQKMFGYVPNNADENASEDRPYYWPVKVLTSRVQLDLLLSQHMEDTPWTDLKQWNFTQFDETFFEKNSLVMVYYGAGTDLPDPTITSFVYTEEGTCLSVRLGVNTSASGDTVLTQWLLFAGIAKSDMEGITVLEAYAEESAADAPASAALSFTGTVTQVDGHAVLMETDDVPQFSSGVWVELGEAELDAKVGEEYVVTYEDIVMPSLPPRITAVTITKP